MILRSRFPKVDISEASSGEEAMSTIQDLPPDLIFLDIHLPGLNGLDLAKEIKLQFPHIVIIIFTNHDFIEFREKAFQCGAEYFVSKHSSNIDDLASIVSDVISRV
jgi:YesN/AraC family two-component response regulator